MAWTYSGDPKSSDKDMYRFLIGDTIATEPVLQDAEIEFVIDAYSSNNARLYKLFEVATNIFAREYKRSLGPQAEDPTERLKYFASNMVYYKKLSSLSGGLSIPVYASDKIFVKGMHDNV